MWELEERIADLEKQLDKAQAENAVLLDQNFAMNKTIANLLWSISPVLHALKEGKEAGAVGGLVCISWQQAEDLNDVVNNK